ncbi:hypothetical protein FWF89_01335 [Candidatus Saccharibacteria bacterium]|nr:hypothetical protein [Candidatus Saccharibacteria bacterium]
MKKKNSKNGAASMFVVVFTTLLLSIIALGFINIMLSEANQTTNYDLSQSAYDSALAGIEDAKIALLKYHECLSRGANASNNYLGDENCEKSILAMTAPGAAQDCDIIAHMLRRPNTGQETIIQSEIGDGTEGTANMEQAYTCVRIDEDTDDYLGTLNPNYRTKVIPIRTADIVNINRIRMSWYNSEDDIKVNSAGSSSFELLPSSRSRALTSNKLGYAHSTFSANSTLGNLPPAPPVMQFQFIQTATSFVLAQLNNNSGDLSDRGTLTLRPVRCPSGSSCITQNVVNSDYSIGLAGSADQSINNPIDIACEMGSAAYRCNADIVIPNPIGGTRHDGSTFVRLVLPYGTPDTSFSLTLFYCPNNATINTDRDCEQKKFAGVQTRVDSTGRANDLFRRVEARVELVDVYFPFPEFPADIGGDGSSGIWKNFWVTRNCWTTGGTNQGTICPNQAEIGGTRPR